jgi:hypothetical protein
MVKDLIELNIKRDTSLVVFIKTCKEWEDIMKNYGRIVEYPNLMKCGKTLKAYEFPTENPLPEGFHHAGFFYADGKFSLAILRLVGISEGITLKFDMLIGIDELQTAADSFIKNFKKNFQNKFKPVEIKIKATFAEI